MNRTALRDSVSAAFRSLQDTICHELAEAAGQTFQEDVWKYEEGAGGGRTRIFEGDVIEKGGVNFSGLEGVLSEKMAARLELGQDRQFYASGVSLVLHPRNPFVPTVHMNVRYLERGAKSWFGGGIDLTPYYPFEDDIVHFHRTLKDTCDGFDAGYYPRFKQACDDYFFLRHRNEARGVGGIFFDYLTGDLEAAFAFTKALGQAFEPAYLPILAARKDIPYGTQQRDFQLYRRGRYVEFNLVYDRGTLFGLETGGRIESILMSLPPLTTWRYDWQPEPGSPEAALTEVLKPRDWAGKS